jgi:hypothetical protein
MARAKYDAGTIAGGRSLNAAIGVANGTQIPIAGAKQVSWGSTVSGTISSGRVAIECSMDPNYTGAWFELGTFDATELNASADGTATGGSGTYPAPPGVVARARLVTAIGGGGNITVYINPIIEDN